MNFLALVLALFFICVAALAALAVVFFMNQRRANARHRNDLRKVRADHAKDLQRQEEKGAVALSNANAKNQRERVRLRRAVKRDLARDAKWAQVFRHVNRLENEAKHQRKLDERDRYLNECIRADAAEKIHTLASASNSVESESRVVVFLEPRKHHLLEACMKNARDHLGSGGWRMQVFHGSSNRSFVQNIAKRLEIDVELVDIGEENLDLRKFNKLVTSEWFWQKVSGDIALLMHTDAWICGSCEDLDEFLKYDYVGAPWDVPGKGGATVGNSGLALCRKSAVLEAIRRYPFEEYVEEHGNDFSDVYFSLAIANKPIFDVAKRFSVENVFYDKPFGVHKPVQFLDALQPHCPGIEILKTY